MYSNLDLLCMFIISLLYVSLFKIQRALTPMKYFSNSEIVMHESVSPMQILIRYVLIGIFSISLSFIFNIQENIIIVGNSLGSFLIIWPALLLPKLSYETFISKENKLLIYFLHIIFIITTGLSTYFSFLLIPLFVRDTSEYISNVLCTGGSMVFGGIIKNTLSKKITRNSNKDEEEYDDQIGKE